MSDFGNLKAYYDITERIKPGDDGYPIFDSIDTIANEYLDDLLKTIQGEEIEDVE